MIDYLFTYDTEALAIAAHPELRSGDQWNAGFVHVCQTYIDSPTEEDPSAITILPGFKLWVCLTSRNDDYEALPSCILVAEREPPLIVHHKLTDEQLSLSKISPVIAGSNYPFGAPPL